MADTLGRSLIRFGIFNTTLDVIIVYSSVGLLGCDFAMSVYGRTKSTKGVVWRSLGTAVPFFSSVITNYIRAAHTL